MNVHIKHFLTIDCSSDIVHDALTTERGIRGWWTVDTKIEPKIGSTAEFIFGDRYHNKMEIQDLQLNQRISWYFIYFVRAVQGLLPE